MNHRLVLADNGPGISARPVFVKPNQRGMALAMALIILMVLTIIGVTVMNLSGLETRMAGNAQETVRAFQQAESAIEQVIMDPAIAYTLTPTNPTATRSYPSSSPTADVVVSYVAKTSPPGRTADPTKIESAMSAKTHFEIVSKTKNLPGKAEIVQGASRNSPAN